MIASPQSPRPVPSPMVLYYTRLGELDFTRAQRLLMPHMLRAAFWAANPGEVGAWLTGGLIDVIVIDAIKIDGVHDLLEEYSLRVPAVRIVIQHGDAEYDAGSLRVPSILTLPMPISEDEWLSNAHAILSV